MSEHRRQEPVWTSVRGSGYSGEVEQRFRGSGTRFPAKWNARRSVATFVGQFPPLGVAADLQDSTRDVVFESMDEDACGACGRRLRRPRCCGKRAFGDRSVAPNASRAFSTSPAGSTGRSDPTCPGHACRRRDGSGLRFAAVMALPFWCSCRLLRAVVRRVVRTSHRAALQLDAVRVVEQAVADGVGLVGVTDDGVPVGHRQLAGDQRGGAFGAVLDHLGQVAALGVTQRREHPVVDGEQVELCQPRHQPRVGTVSAADGHLVQQARHADVAGGEAAATRPFDEGATEKTLPDSTRPGDDQVVALGEPRAGSQRQDLLAVEPSGRREVDGLERRRMTQLGRLQAPFVREHEEVIISEGGSLRTVF